MKECRSCPAFHSLSRSSIQSVSLSFCLSLNKSRHKKTTHNQTTKRTNICRGVPGVQLTFNDPRPARWVSGHLLIARSPAPPAANWVRRSPMPQPGGTGFHALPGADCQRAVIQEAITRWRESWQEFRSARRPVKKVNNSTVALQVFFFTSIRREIHGNLYLIVCYVTKANNNNANNIIIIITIIS